MLYMGLESWMVFMFMVVFRGPTPRTVVMGITDQEILRQSFLRYMTVLQNGVS